MGECIHCSLDIAGGGSQAIDVTFLNTQSNEGSIIPVVAYVYYYPNLLGSPAGTSVSVTSFGTNIW